MPKYDVVIERDLKHIAVEADTSAQAREKAEKIMNHEVRFGVDAYEWWVAEATEIPKEGADYDDCSHGA